MYAGLCVMGAIFDSHIFISLFYSRSERLPQKLHPKKNKELETCFLVSKRFAYDGDDDDPNPVHVGTSEPTEDDDLRETG